MVNGSSKNTRLIELLSNFTSLAVLISFCSFVDMILFEEVIVVIEVIVRFLSKFQSTSVNSKNYILDNNSFLRKISTCTQPPANYLQVYGFDDFVTESSKVEA